MAHGHGNLMVALVGQPNCGKTTLFNALTGARQHVANFPGVTVESKAGSYRWEAEKVEVIDLPGTYSLSSYSPEERVTRDLLLLEQPEAVVAVVDAANLPRSLGLLAQLREMELPLVVCLNMIDVARRRGIEIDTEKLSRRLGALVVTTVASRGEGIDELKRTIATTVRSTDHAAPHWRIDYGEVAEGVLDELESELQQREHLMEDFPARWLAVRLAEGDEEARRIVLHHTHDADGAGLLASLEERLEGLPNEADGQAPIQAGRLAWSRSVADQCLHETQPHVETLTDRLDRVLLGRWVGGLILMGIIFVFYQVTMVGGTWLSERFLAVIEWAVSPVEALFASDHLLETNLVGSLVVDGVLAGVLAILEYLPLFVLLFALIAVLEDTGYMARIAFLMDRLLRRFGLHGQSTLPLLLGGVVVGGCAVPGVMATRAMHDRRARLVTILVIPLMNCMAKVPFYVLVVGVFLGGPGPWAPVRQGLVLLGISLVSLLAALATARLFSKYLVPGETEPFVMELPPYHMPTLRGVLQRTGERMWHFVKKVLTVVVAAMVLVWALATLPGLGEDEQARFQQELTTARERLDQALPADSPFDSLAKGPQLVQTVRFAEDLQQQRLAAESDADLAAINARARTTDPLRYALVTGEDGSAGAAEASAAFNAFREALAELRDRRDRLRVHHSLAGRLGRAMEPVTQLAGFDWRVNIAILSSFAAKENMVGSLGTLHSTAGMAPPAGQQLGPGGNWTVWHGLSILALVMLFPPCVPTLAAIRAETGSWRWMVFTAVYPLAMGFALAVAIFQLGRLVGG